VAGRFINERKVLIMSRKTLRLIALILVIAFAVTSVGLVGMSMLSGF
jgi:hypothetical protein